MIRSGAGERKKSEVGKDMVPVLRDKGAIKSHKSGVGSSIAPSVTFVEKGKVE